MSISILEWRPLHIQEIFRNDSIYTGAFLLFFENGNEVFVTLVYIVHSLKVHGTLARNIPKRTLYSCKSRIPP